MTTSAQERDLQHRILEMLSATQHGLTVPEVAETLDIERHHVHYAMLVLFEAGLVVWSRDRVWTPGRPPHRYRLVDGYR